VVEVMPSSSTEGAVESTSSGSANRSASRPSANRIQNSLDGRPVGEPLNHPGSDADLNSTRSAMVATPNDPTGTPTQSDGGGSAGGAPSANTGPPPSAVNAAAARTTSLPPCDSTASPNAVVRPLRVSVVPTTAGPAVPGRRKKPETTTGSGKGITGPSARRQMASMYPPLTAPLVPFHRPLSEAAKHPEESEATTRVSASNAYSPI
jgi:hypothetical protein